jgi:hypothetical protein
MRSRALLFLILLQPAALAGQAGPGTPNMAVLDQGIARMGGDSLLRSITAVRLDMLTQWLRTSFADAPFTDMPSYERNVELRNYRTASWRNTRYFAPAAPRPGVIVVVRDTIALFGRQQSVTDSALEWAPLNVAYVDERRELFAFEPVRLMLALRDATDLQVLPDTAIDGDRHVRLASTIDGWSSVTFLRHSDGLPRMVRFRADETNDFGLAPWAEHEVEFWFSSWTLVRPGLLLPRQRDVRRVGRPYKRMTVLQATINPVAPADSFAVSDSLARAYLATEQRPMWQLPLDSLARIERDAFAVVPPLLGSAGAVRIGGQWLVMEAAQAVGAMDLLAKWLEQHGGRVPVAGAMATNVWTGNGGAPWFTNRRLPVHVALGAMPTLQRINGGARGLTPIDEPGWIAVGTDSLWVEPLTVPDMPGTMMVYSPTLRWLWLPFAGSPAHAADQAAIIDRLERRGFTVELLGGPRALVTPR